MAKPQVEDGHIRIANELYDAIARFPFTAGQLRCVLAIMRFTYGGLHESGGQGKNRKTCILSYRRIARYTQMSRANVHRTLAALVKMSVLSRWKTTRQSYSWAVQKDYERWRGVSSEKRQKCPVSDDTSVPSQTTGCPVSDDRQSVPSQTTPQDLTPSDDGSRPKEQTVSERRDGQTKEYTYTYTKDPASTEKLSSPGSFSELPEGWKTRLTDLAREKGFEQVEGFRVYAWMTQRLQANSPSTPEGLEWILSNVTPRGESSKNLYAICNHLACQAENEAAHAKVKKETCGGGSQGGMRSLAEILGQAR